MGLLLEPSFNERHKQECDLHYLSDEHPRGHGETGSRGEVTRDHDSHTGLGEGQLVGVGTKQLVHHQHRGFPVVVGCQKHTNAFRSTPFFPLYAQEVFFCLQNWIKKAKIAPFFSSTAVASQPSSNSELLAAPFRKVDDFFFRLSRNRTMWEFSLKETSRQIFSIFDNDNYFFLLGSFCKS